MSTDEWTMNRCVYCGGLLHSAIFASDDVNNFIYFIYMHTWLPRSSMGGLRLISRRFEIDSRSHFLNKLQNMKSKYSFIAGVCNQVDKRDRYEQRNENADQYTVDSSCYQR